MDLLSDSDFGVRHGAITAVTETLQSSVGVDDLEPFQAKLSAAVRACTSDTELSVRCAAVELLKVGTLS